MTRIIQKHRCRYQPNPFNRSGHEVRVETLDGELIGCADPFPDGEPCQKWRREDLIKQVAKALIRAKEQELVK